MITIDLTFAILSLVILNLLLAMSVKYELMMMQQNSYRPERYFKWLKKNVIMPGRMLSLLLLILFFVFYTQKIIAGAILALLLIRSIYLYRKKYKKPLVFTARATRLYLYSLFLAVQVILFPLLFTGNLYFFMLTTAVPAVFAPIVILIAVWQLTPVENRINRYYYRDAQKILSGMPNLLIIGVTGSYGKTSTKHYLHRVLSEKYNVLMTPGSYNTLLGVIRTIREDLRSYHEVFIVEMGAKQPGDIKDICDLVHPKIGIITAVGEQHLETFLTIERVQATKFELIDALPTDGLAVLNNDYPYIANRKVENVNQVIRYAIDKAPDSDYHVQDIIYSASGTEFGVVGNEKGERISTKLVGSCNISNLLATYIVAEYLQVPDLSICYGIRRIEQVEHRLNVKRTAGGVIIIDDAFNSNPDGAKMALDVIAKFDTGRRFIVTPGLVELGEKQEFYNERLGLQMASSCDYAVIVNRYNKEALSKGLREGGMKDENILYAKTFLEASAQLNKMLQRSDVVLYENDLPDTYK